MCGYESPFFGATYPDGICIDGYMWDLDSCDEPGGALTSGGEIPCPDCSPTAYLKNAKEDAEETVSFASWPVGGCGTGADIWRCAVALVSSIHGSAVADIIKEIGPVKTYDVDANMLQASQEDG